MTLNYFISISYDSFISGVNKNTKLIEMSRKGKQEIQFKLQIWKEIIRFLHLGDLNMVKFWIEKGADLNSKDEDEKTPLIFAAENGNHW